MISQHLCCKDLYLINSAWQRRNVWRRLQRDSAGNGNKNKESTWSRVQQHDGQSARRRKTRLTFLFSNECHPLQSKDGRVLTTLIKTLRSTEVTLPSPDTQLPRDLVKKHIVEQTSSRGNDSQHAGETVIENESLYQFISSDPATFQSGVHELCHRSQTSTRSSNPDRKSVDYMS